MSHLSFSVDGCIVLHGGRLLGNKGAAYMMFVFQVVYRVTYLQEKGDFNLTSQRNLTMSRLKGPYL